MALIHNKDLPESGESRLGPPDLTARDSIADTLRLARQEHGQDLRTVAQILRIRYTYLEAIEKGAFEQLPGTAYVLGFLRTYAEFLGLDGQQIVERYKCEVQGVEPKLDLVFPEPVGHNRIPGGAIVLISVVLLGLAYGGWFYLSNQGKSIADLMPRLPERLLAMIYGDDDGQGAAVDAVGGPAPPAYSPPESAEAESQEPTELADPANDAVTEPPAPTELAAREVPAPVADFEAAQDDVVAPAAAEANETPAPEVVETSDPPAPDVAPDVVPDVAEPLDTPVPETVETAEAPASETMVETAEAVPPALAPAPPASAEPELSVATGDSFLALAAPVRHETTASVGSIEPLLDETVVIPAPPTASRDLVLSTERLPRVYGESNLGTRIVLRALQDSWVQVRDRQDALLLTRVLRSGDTYYVPNQDGLTLLTGNAGGIAIEVDGVAVAPLGPVGAVRRQIALDPVRLLDGTALRR